MIFSNILRRRVRYDGSEIIIERITYPNNSSVTQIVEDGKTYRQEQFNNYDLLRSNLTIKNSPSLLRLEERFVTKMDQTEHVGPVASVYSVAFSAVSLVLGVYGLPGSAITGIVGMLIGLGGSTIEADIRTIRNFYGIYDVTGSFLGYYKVSYAVHTTAHNTDGSKIELKPEVGTYETLEIS